jgi:hypothetical protein
MEKYLPEWKCKICEYRQPTSWENARQELDAHYKQGAPYPSHCDTPMKLHSYRPTRYQFCSDNRCLYGQGNYCACTCEASFHGMHAGRTKKAQYIYA